MLLKSTTYDERLEKNWKWCKTYFDRKVKEFNLIGWTIDIDHATRRLGLCNYNKKKITISYHLLRGPSCDEKQMRNTVLHELAHAIVGPNHNHDETWKKMALRIGCDAKRCGSMDLVEATYILECPKKCFSRGYYRRPKTDNKICMKCHSVPILKLLK